MMMTIGSMEANKEDDQLLLPGFRFHPTDEELLSFYLRRKIENKLITIEFIKQIDIYKYDPWDLAKDSRTVTDKEWYFFCRRGRKYRNSVRPNRVTGSGFWKATGIDKPIYSVEGQGCGEFIGLKKTLVYYRGSAGRGTKTDWMMHEFRLPTDQKNTDLPHAKAADQEAEVWTLCRIFKRNLSHGRYTPDCRKVAAAKRNPSNAKRKSCDVSSENWGGYIGFGAPVSLHHKEKKPVGSHIDAGNPVLIDQVSFINVQSSQPESCSSSILSDDAREFFAHGNWDELVPVMELPFDPSYVNNF